MVGAGVAGLAAAEVLAHRADVVVLDRLPVPGGVLPFDAPAVRSLEQRCRSAGVRWLLGAVAIFAGLNWAGIMAQRAVRPGAYRPRVGS